MDFRINRWEGYKEYHRTMVRVGDCDPQYPALRYIADRFELNLEQRYWLAWLYSISYCAPTAYYMLSEFPDFENVDTRRLDSWWWKNKHKTYFQTDRRWVRSSNQVIRMFESYRDLVGGSQSAFYQEDLLRGDPMGSYKVLYDKLMKDLYFFNRYSLFLLTESLYELTGLPIEADTLDLRPSSSESCRNGLCYATVNDRWIKKLPPPGLLEPKLVQLYDEIKQESKEEGIPCTYWGIETSLCAYKKLFWRKRYLGYYIDRLMGEIMKLQGAVRTGVDWSVLWDFRREYFHPMFLGEVRGWRGPRKKMMGFMMETGRIYPLNVGAIRYKHNVEFKEVELVYQFDN